MMSQPHAVMMMMMYQFYTNTYWCRWWLHSFENDNVVDEENFRWFIDMPVNVPRWYWWCYPLTHLMLLMMLSYLSLTWCCWRIPFLLCWNNVTAKCILIIIWYIIHWINPHCGLIMLAIVKRPNPFLRIGYNIIVIGKRRSRPHNISKRPRNIIKAVITTQFEKLSLPMKRHFTRARFV